VIIKKKYGLKEDPNRDSSLFWGITQRRLGGCYRRFGTFCWSPCSMSSSIRPGQTILVCLTLEEGIDRFLRNVDNYKSALCNTPEERRSPLNSDGSLKSHENLKCIQRHDHGVSNCFEVYELGYVLNDLVFESR